MIHQTRTRERILHSRILTVLSVGLVAGASLWTLTVRPARPTTARPTSLAYAKLELGGASLNRADGSLSRGGPLQPAERKAVKHIAALVETLRPRQGPDYAWSVACHVVRSAHDNGVSPYIVSATAVVESEFSMDAGPCIGMMQMNPATVSEVYGRSGRNVYGLEDNIWMGANFLAINYRSPLASRGGTEIARMRHMWGRYNGAGPESVYATRALRVLRRIRQGNPDTWKKTIAKKGSLWGI